MRKLLFIFACLLLVNGGYANVAVVAPSKKASEIFIPVGKSGQKISLLELSQISMKDLQTLTGKKMSFSEKMAYKAGQRSLRKNIHKDGTIDKGFINKMTKADDLTSGFHLGGFALGFFLFLIGVLIAYLIDDDKKNSRVKWAWIGAAVIAVIGLIFAVI